MPSDARIQLALDAVRGQIAAFRAAATSAAERARGVLAAAGAGGADRARVELGALGAMRIDASRFAELSRGAVLDPPARQLITRAADILRELSELPDDAYVVEVPQGARAEDAVAEAYRKFGRAFGAAQATDLVRAGRIDLAHLDEPGARHGFDHWTTSERAIAPPVVVVVNGADLHAAELGELLDGITHIVVVVEGACPPAALARLITPGTFVLQTANDRGLDRFRDFAGPAVAALVDDDAACFVHDPRRGAALWQRLEVWKQPAVGKRARIGGLSVRQQREDIAQLAALATQPALPTGSVGELVPAGGDAVDRLTDWLLAESGLSGAER